MSYPFKLPEENTYTNRVPRSEITVVGQGSPGRPIARYSTQKVIDDDVHLFVFEWMGSEYEEDYVIFLIRGEITIEKIHKPEYENGFFSQKGLISAIEQYLQTANKEPRKIIQSVGIRSYEPWKSREEYEKFLHQKQDEASWNRERSTIHEEAREKRKKEKKSQEIVDKLENNQHEFEIPDMPDTNDDIEELKQKYSEGEITLLEFEERIERRMN